MINNGKRTRHLFGNAQSFCRTIYYDLALKNKTLSYMMKLKKTIAANHMCRGVGYIWMIAMGLGLSGKI